MAIQLANVPVSATGVKSSHKAVGIAFADTSVRELGVADFIDNDIFSNTEVSEAFYVFTQYHLLRILLVLDNPAFGEGGHCSNWVIYWDNRT
jgi:hypothetical protein